MKIDAQQEMANVTRTLIAWTVTDAERLRTLIAQIFIQLLVHQHAAISVSTYYPVSLHTYVARYIQNESTHVSI